MERFDEVYQQIDPENSGVIGFNEFLSFFNVFFKSNSKTSEKILNHLFNGIDVEGQCEITREQLYNVVNAIISEDIVEFNKYIFISLDTNKDGKITRDALMELAMLNNIVFKRSHLSRVPKNISFSQAMEIMFDINANDLEPLRKNDAANQEDDYNDALFDDNNNDNKKKRYGALILIGAVAAACAGTITYFAFGRKNEIRDPTQVLHKLKSK